MDAAQVLEQLKGLGVAAEVEDGTLYLEPFSLVPDDLLVQVRDHKLQLMELLSKPPVVDALPEWHANEIARQVEAEGICVFWASVLGALVAFVRSDADLARVPAGIVAFTSAELAQLFPDGEEVPSASVLRLLYEGKRLGGNGKAHRE